MKKKQTFFYNPDNPKKSFDVYIDKDPSDTIPIKYTTYNDVKNTIKHLEKLYRQNKYPHKRIFQVAMIMMVRLNVIVKRFKKGQQRYRLAKRYKDFLNKRTKLKDLSKRRALKFKFHLKKTYKNKRDYLLSKCGLPDINETNHCFADGTHHTCCLLDKKARDYADKSGNPIGIASEKAFKKKNKRNPNMNDKTPWCTCSGSSVCGFYKDKFKKTKIAFMNNPFKNMVAHNIQSQKCEKYARDKMGVIPHLTPGVFDNTNNKMDCSKIKYKSIYNGKNKKKTKKQRKE